MHIQASRLQTTLATLARAVPTPAVQATVATATPTPTTSGTASDTVTISQAAQDLLAQTHSSVSLSSRAMDLLQRRNPYDSAPYSASDSGNPQAEVRKVMDNLTLQRNNRQISDTRYQHDMAFYTRVANAIV